MLSEILQLDIFRFMMAFARIGSALMLLPGIGGHLVSIRIRMWIALSLAFLMLPVVGAAIPSMPKSVGGILMLTFGEIVIGLFLGTVVSFVMSVLSLAGSMIGYQTGLTNAFSFDPIAQQQSQLLTGFLSNIGLLAIFATNLHHLMFQAIAESYDLFHPGQPLPWGDFTETLSHLVTETFRLGLQFSAPLVVAGLIFYTGLGLLSRLIPQLQIFFISQPIQILVGFWMFMASLPMITTLFLKFFEDSLIPYLPPR
ncbi:flagellar type III secretion system protein FliR [Paramagnetospirillum kuznetsovii]|uniref:Flagellar biosynthetic protein FliR n=1 Tax=Paramagnetospirillum kuznetsovii TaxID=2053833 RepID=A0A364NSY4_9PROT|nr:flagellar biosynthetic protein FliR [Paramagnetospirillum kuznetsovii]RAU20186.1 flagellar type III secretion system protein FliR [Paramagnetospirillum kuznetsovii]